MSGDLTSINMTDRILEIGQGALETSDLKVKAMMQNIVNAQTPGYKKEDLSIKAFPSYLENATNKIEKTDSLVPRAAGVFTSYQQGPLQKTGNSTDIALGGSGFFVLQGPDGEIFTRDGRFTLDEEGKLISVSGHYPVLGQGGQINIVPGAKLDISQSGKILVDEVETDKLKVVEIDNTQKLETKNHTFFSLPKNASNSYSEIESPRVLQGFVEASNVSIMDEMMNMVSLSQIYNINTKVVQARDASLSRALEMGKPSQ